PRHPRRKRLGKEHSDEGALWLLPSRRWTDLVPGNSGSHKVATGRKAPADRNGISELHARSCVYSGRKRRTLPAGVGTPAGPEDDRFPDPRSLGKVWSERRPQSVRVAVVHGRAAEDRVDQTAAGGRARPDLRRTNAGSCAARNRKS